MFESTLGRALIEEELDFRSLIARQKMARPPYQALEGERIPTRIYFDNDTSANRTILEIETEDRVGLLHVISQALTELNLDISLAKISTEKGAAIDTFYVCEQDGQKIVWPERQKLIEERLRAGLASAFGS